MAPKVVVGRAINQEDTFISGSGQPSVLSIYLPFYVPPSPLLLTQPAAPATQILLPPPPLAYILSLPHSSGFRLERGLASSAGVLCMRHKGQEAFCGKIFPDKMEIDKNSENTAASGGGA